MNGDVAALLRGESIIMYNIVVIFVGRDIGRDV